VPALAEAERETLKASLRSPDAFVLRRAQIVLASAGGERSGQITPCVGLTPQPYEIVRRRVGLPGARVAQQAKRPHQSGADGLPRVGRRWASGSRSALMSPHYSGAGAAGRCAP
jgi:hypothetical protein